MAGPIYAVLPGMGEEILIQVFVVIVIGGIGSIRGALVGARGRRHGGHAGPRLPQADAEHGDRGPSAANDAGPALASMLIYLLMAAVLFFRPAGLVSRRPRLTMDSRARAIAVSAGLRRAGPGAGARRASSTSPSTSTSSGGS